MLARTGHLAALYTDFSAHSPLGRALQRVPSPFYPCRLARTLERRTVAGVPEEKIRATDAGLLPQLLHRAGLPRRWIENGWGGPSFARQLIRWGCADADILYTTFTEAGEFASFVCEQGLTVAMEVYINVMTHHIEREERRAFPGWEPQSDPTDEAHNEGVVARAMNMADLLICPNETVARSLAYYGDGVVERSRIVPYAAALPAKPREQRPVQGRILFPGAALLRKGIHYFAAAARSLRDAGRDYEFRVAGAVSPAVARRPECSALRFLGTLGRAEMVEEFRLADAVVLPSLAEGSPSALLEALAFGVPVITTSSAGAPVDPERNGLIVPERSAEALAGAIDRLVRDRALRDALSREARAGATAYTEDEWAAGLLAALLSFRGAASSGGKPRRRTGSRGGMDPS